MAAGAEMRVCITIMRTKLVMMTVVMMMLRWCQYVDACCCNGVVMLQ